MLSIVIIAVGLSMDALAISIVSGGAYKRLHVVHALRVGAFFGGAQAIMPVIGYLAGLGLKSYLQGIDHWVAFGILLAIGVKMIYEAFKIKEAEEKMDVTSLMVLLTLSVATSIDALAVGLTLPLISATPIVEAAVIIGIVTFAICFMGVYIGHHAGHFFETKMEVLGGLALIAIGTKILIEHLVQ
jgi:putative Mn2+ efflux pump MntP